MYRLIEDNKSKKLLRHRLKLDKKKIIRLKDKNGKKKPNRVVMVKIVQEFYDTPIIPATEERDNILQEIINKLVFSLNLNYSFWMFLHFNIIG